MLTVPLPLVELNLNGVVGTGSIPSEIGLLANLTTLVLKGEVDISLDSFSSNRGFSGSIPSEIGKLSQLGKFGPANSVRTSP
jgi:hypothetical protein